jgi:thiol-disulfide isomerase/thioredoxin
MNARASVVDAWRLIQFNANFLESDLDFVFTGELANQNENKPFSLSGKNGRLRMGLQYDPPLTRLADRNAYRQSLIEYQQAKRQYYQFRDRVQRDLRATLRQMKLDDLNLELRRAAVLTAITQVDLARLRLSEPARPVAATAPGQPAEPGGQSQFGDTVAGVAALAAAVYLRAGAGEPTDAVHGHAQLAASYAAPTLDGDTVAIAELRGSVVLVNLWATWCRPCVEELPSLQRLEEGLADDGLRVLAINVDRLPPDRAADEVSRFLDELGVDLTVLLDPAGRAETVFGSIGLPTTLVIDRRGDLAYRRLGAGDWDRPPLRDYVVKALER